MSSQCLPASTTVDCYEFWDRVFRRGGVLDYTEGLYHGDPAIPYQEAQQNQIRFLLDEVGCGEGSRILDIGCGNGTLLDEVRRRGAAGVGVTISPQQARFCRRRGLDVDLRNYRDIAQDWNGRFDAVIANGPIEHFVQPADALEGRADAIYHEFFAICHRLLDPRSASRRLMNTTIHFGRVHVEPGDALRSPWSFRWFSDRFHYALLVRGFGGYYPAPGQLQRCARPYFNLVEQRDATCDYRLTSEEWLRYGLRSFFSLRQWGRLLPFALRHPRHAARMLFLLLVSQSWNWQFRGEPSPMQHLWQTWEYVPSCP
jgi:cyclopropane fatty-acyl-phospholipid synthase-like methyltransferase